MRDTALTIEYGAIQGTYWMAYASISSFASAFLVARGYSNSEIGLLIAIGNILAVVLQPVIADFADRSRKATLAGISTIMTFMMIGLAVCQLILGHRSLLLFIVCILIAALMACVLPLFNTMNFDLQKCGVELNFGLCRSGGSFAYATLCLFLGTLVEMFGVSTIPISSIICLSLIILSVYLATARYKTLYARNLAAGLISEVQSRQNKSKENEITLLDFVKNNKMFLVLNIGVFVLYTHNQLLNSFMYQILIPIGGNSEDMGRIFALMAYMEIPAMVLFDRINRRISCQKLIIFSSCVFICKISIVFLAKSVTMVYVAQLLQGFSYGLLIPALVKFIAQTMEPGEQVKGQALCTMMMSISAIVGSLAGGWILDFSGAKALLAFGVFMASTGTLIMALSVNKIKKKH